MNKTEKLLAARKRLKEFQLNRKIQSSDNGSVNPNETTAAPAPSQDKDESIDPNQNVTSEVATVESQNEHESPRVEATLEVPPPTNQNVRPMVHDLFEIPPTNVSDLTEISRGAIESSDRLTSCPDIFPNANHAPPLSQNLGNYFSNNVSSEDFITGEIQRPVETSEGSHEPENSVDQIEEKPRDHSSNDFQLLNGSSSLQKEYLRQMTSAVTNLLDIDDDTETRNEPRCDLEQRNEFLTSCLDEHKQSANELYIELGQYKSRVAELESILATRDRDIESKSYQEINHLKEQLQAHVQTTGILVGEKAELTAQLLQCQTSAKQKSAQVEDLNGRLKSLQIHCADLERELNAVRNNSEDAGKINLQLQTNYDSLQSNFAELRRDKDDLELEVSELKQKLTVKNTELMNAQEELKEKVALLSLNELRIQQMTSSSPDTRNTDESHHVVAALEQQLSQLMETLKSVSEERDEASSHYQNYVQQLNSQVTTLAQKLEDTMKENVEIGNREHSLVKRLSEMERQLQIQKELTPTIAEPAPSPPDNSEQLSALTKTIDDLIVERDGLRALLYEKESSIESLKREVEDLQEIRSRDDEASRLNSALEGERLAAARAVSQNQQLKQQLTEMQDAYIQLSNTKLDLTEQLQAERTIGRKLNAKLNETENDVEKLKEQVAEKMKFIAELEKEKLQVAQVTDQMQHYQAQSHNANTLQRELHQAKELIDILSKENKQLMGDLFTKKQRTDVVDDAGVQQTRINGQLDGVEQTDGATQTIGVTELDASVQSDEILVDSTTKSVKLSAVETQTETPEDDAVTTPVEQQQPVAEIGIIAPEAVKKLEDRFKSTMERLAEVSDEKQRLEHLVMQLQSETETIGEYVTLYQNQRGILQERAKAKEQAFVQLTDQYNQQQEQLHKLKKLVTELIREKTSRNQIAPVHVHEDQTEIKENEERSAIETQALVKDPTTSRILDLLTEIKECKDNACASDPNFHPCPWCSGKLITV